MEFFLKEFEECHPRAGRSVAWSDRLRREGIRRFGELGLPTTELEDWRYTSLEPMREIRFKTAGVEGEGGRGEGGKIESDFALRSSFYTESDLRVVFVNGHYTPELSSSAGLPKGTIVGNLATFLRKDPETIERYLSRTAAFQDRALVALNTAFFQDGAFLSIPAGVVLKRPLYVCHLSWNNETGHPIMSYPRNLIVLGEGSEAQVIEIYMGGGEEGYFTNAVTEVSLSPGSAIDHYRLQQESGKAYHIASVDVVQERDSRFSSNVISLGGALSRNEVRTVLDAEGTECVLNGLYMVTGRQHVDNQTLIDHAKPHGTSSELYKGILSGQSRGVFNGRIVVRPKAQKTSARQTNRNLILSDEALINTKPLLEIFANDVKCNHGATIGRLDENQVFYLRARGMAASNARSLLTYAFASDLVGKVQVPSLRTALEKWIFRRLLASDMTGVTA